MGNIHDRLRKIHVLEKRTERNLNIQVVGERLTGKTSLIKTFVNECPSKTKSESSDVPDGRIDMFHKKIKVKHKEVILTIFDCTTSSDVKYHSLVQGIIICFSLDSQESLQKVDEFWVPELKKHYPKVPMLLVGTKRDLRDNAKKIGSFVREVKGRLLAQKHKLKGFIECSSDTGEKVEEVFYTMTLK